MAHPTLASRVAPWLMTMSWVAPPLPIIAQEPAPPPAQQPRQQPQQQPAIRVGGFVHGQAEFGDQGDSRFHLNDRFFLRRARLEARGRLAPDFDFRVMIDAAPGLSGRSDATTTLVDGFVRWVKFPAATVTFGQFKAPFTHEDLVSATQLVTIERALPTDRLRLARQVGIQLGGGFAGDRVTYAAGLFNGLGTNSNVNDDERFIYAGRVTAVPWRRGTGPGSAVQWSVGGGAYSSHDAAARLSSEFGFDADATTPARDNTLAGRRVGLGLDTQLRLGPVELWGEYLRVRFEPRNAVPLIRFVSDGWYAQGSGFVVPDRMQLVAKYETFDPNRSAGTATKTWLLGINNYIRGNNLKLQLNYMRSDAEALPRLQHKLIARVQVMFST